MHADPDVAWSDARVPWMTKDPVLIKVKASKTKVDPVMAKHSLMQELDPNELLLRLAVGQSDTVLSKRFLVERLKIGTMRHDLEKRYQTMFQWLNGFRRMALAKRYATNGDSLLPRSGSQSGLKPCRWCYITR